ncbi:MAG: DNA mismatch repair protein MutL [Bdellovibrio sp. CG10_big_fil_rev_8_21_14_0_10_47_8]|nr:MAG: DNA mismatch repair protein MutL [Bdellovibrio sp. CG10_big_fil_rev_8_21_14_0_10_47_8]
MTENTPVKIESLSDEVVDQIAAGEVVERPAHLVKELVENSLDAGATEIRVQFSDGGRNVTVTDNGVGIDPRDLGRALDRHATSKIKISTDLWRLKSFGFRGEALASISAVCRLTLISKPHRQKNAARLISHFGTREAIEEIGGASGTSVGIEDLFSNVPARLKFMKSSSAENTRIRAVLKAMALSHPEVQFHVEQEGQLIHLWPATKTKIERVQQILGLKNVFEGRAVRGDVQAYAVFTDPQTVQRTAKDLWFFAQNRWIQDRSLQAAVMEAYRHLLMHGEYPSAVVWVETSPENIDVNIHPTKSQVKFADPSLAFRAVQAAIRDVLETAPWIPAGAAVSTKRTDGSNDQFFQQPQFQSEDLLRTQYATKESQEASGVMEALKTFRPPSFSRPPVTSVLPETSEQNSGSVTTKSDQRSYWSQFQVLAQTNLTYILTQNKDGLMIVDQHAAHERVIFERLMSAWKGGQAEVQEFLFPLAIDLSPDEVEALIAQQESLARLGLTVEALGPETVGVKSAPSLLKETALTEALRKMAHELVQNSGSFALEKRIGDLIATMACHSAIRAGQPLSTEEMKSLLVSMDEFPLSSFCPHGRPVSVSYPFYEMEKDFGRIV